MHLKTIYDVYRKGGNIIEYLRKTNNSLGNKIEDILISYDFQSGTYIKDYLDNKEFVFNYCRSLAKIIDSIDEVDSIIEIGVGEATTLSNLIRLLNTVPKNIYGFDISYSRLKFAKGLLKDFNIGNVNLFTANLFEIPLPDSSIDIVYTSHSIEPNGGNEEEALIELFRITKKYLILLEPSFEFGNDESKARMIKHGYVTKLYSTASKLNYNIIEHRLFDYSRNSLNPTGLIIIKKNSITYNNPNLICPITHTELFNYSDSLLYSKEGFLAYPVVDGIPCLLRENSILATHLLTDYETYKKENDIVIDR